MWQEYESTVLRRRYDRLAPIYTLLEYALLTPFSLRRKAVESLDLAAGERVLEIGCGTGRNFPYLYRAVGSTGHIYGVDLSERMIEQARRRCLRARWNNISLICGDAALTPLPVALDGVLFCLSYSTMAEHELILQKAWRSLKSGGRIVIADARLPQGKVGNALRPILHWISRKTVLGNPERKPWRDMAQLTPEVHFEALTYGGGYFICYCMKPEKTTSKNFGSLHRT